MRKTIIFAASLLLFAGVVIAQPKDRPVYPQNPDCPGLKNPSNFTFSGNWTGYTGEKNQILSTCTYLGSTFNTTVSAAQLESVTGSTYCTQTTSTNIDGNSDQYNRFVIKGPGYDTLTNFQLSYLPPDTSFHTSIRIGNSCHNAEAEMLTYQMTVNASNSLLTLWYALSIEDARHGTSDANPEFAVIVEKQRIINGVPVPDTWDLAYGDTLCFGMSTPTNMQTNIAPFVDVGSNLYTPWDKLSINLYHLYGQTIRIKIYISDCAMSGHYGYCYITGECQPMVLRANGCAAGESEEVARVYAPKDGVNYQWYRSKSGVLNGSARDDDNNYVLIPGATEDSLNCLIDYFVRIPYGDTVTQSTFMCKMITCMNTSQNLNQVSKMITNVGISKPLIVVDSLFDCNGGVTLRDLSVTPYAPDDSNLVDTSLTQWRFYNSNSPFDQTLAGTYTGGTASHTFPFAGNNYSVKVRTSAYDTTCWNEKTIPISVKKSPVPRVFYSPETPCQGDTVTLFNRTIGSNYHCWRLRNPYIDTTYVTYTPVTRWDFDTTTQVTLITHGTSHFMVDTDNDGILDVVYCYADTTFDLIVYYTTYSTDTLVVDPSQFPYNYNDVIISESGDYDVYAVNQYGCDSIISLHIESNDGIGETDALGDIHIYPNPTNGTVTIFADNVSSIEVLDVSGRVLVATSNANTVDLAPLPVGTYLLRITTPLGTVTRKVTKMN